MLNKHHTAILLCIFNKKGSNKLTANFVNENFKEVERATVNENISALKNAGITVNLKSEFHQKFTIIDNATIWYGSVNFLSFGSHEESIMRFESTDIATELLTSL